MENEENGIQRKRCPLCQTAINCCLRYGNVTKKIFEDIALVKKKIFDMREHPQEFARTVTAEIRRVNDFVMKGTFWSTLNHPIKQSIAGTLLRFSQLVSPPKGKNKQRQQSLDGDQRHKIQATLDLIDRMCKLIEKIIISPVDKSQKAAPVVQLKPDHIKDLLDQLQILFTSFHYRNRISNNEYQDFIDEIERLDLIRAYYLLLCSPYYSTRCIVAPKLMIIKRNLIDNVTKLDDARKTETVKELEETAKILHWSTGHL